MVSVFIQVMGGLFIGQHDHSRSSYNYGEAVSDYQKMMEYKYVHRNSKFEHSCRSLPCLGTPQEGAKIKLGFNLTQSTYPQRPFHQRVAVLVTTLRVLERSRHLIQTRNTAISALQALFYTVQFLQKLVPKTGLAS